MIQQVAGLSLADYCAGTKLLGKQPARLVYVFMCCGWTNRLAANSQNAFGCKEDLGLFCLGACLGA